MNLFDLYGIKEVADVTIYSIHKKEDGSGDVYYVPALYLDTLKVTTVEKTAENTWAQGGLGNSRLVSWDYGKIINLTLEDALCTPASLGLCWGGILSADWKDAQVRHQYGIIDANSCNGIERISRMEKAFYPRNDATSAVVSNLLPRDGKEDIYKDQSGDRVYLQRSSVLDGTVVRGFGYVDSHPYKWNLEIETAVKSIAMVPDRFFSIYGKAYPIKRRQTVGINQPSESFKYEIIYLRGYDKYDDEGPQARIIYHRQAEQNISHEYVCENDKDALAKLDNFNDYPYLKIRVCFDGSIKVYLGTANVDWDLTRGINGTAADADNAWYDVTSQVNTSQFENITLWLRFDSINALAYYLLTKHEEDIFDIDPKIISSSLNENAHPFKKFIKIETDLTGNRYWSISSGSYHINTWPTKASTVRNGAQAGVVYANKTINELNVINDGGIYCRINTPTAISTDDASTAEEAFYKALLYQEGLATREAIEGTSIYHITPTIEGINVSAENVAQSEGLNPGSAAPAGYIKLRVETEPMYIDVASPPGAAFVPLIKWDSEENKNKLFTNLDFSGTVAGVVGLDYELETPEWLDSEANECTPCCKKSNLSRAIWAYVNPKTMTPYDDDYWFHQGEIYYKKSLTLSTKEQPLGAKKIMVQAGEFPGMYKIVGETYIRNRDTGKDERIQLSFPLCKIKSDQTLTLQADGDPTTFNLDVEVATPQNGIPMEITFYDVEKDMKLGCSGNMIERDGSTKISAR